MSALNPFFGIGALLIALLSAAAVALVLPAPPIKRYSSLDGLRGILAVLVLINHAANWYAYARTGVWAAPPSRLYSHFGQTSVALFFMITAFLFGSKLLEARERPMSWLRLYVSRGLRLVPLYVFFVAVVSGMAVVATRFALHESILRFGLEVTSWLTFTIGSMPAINGFPAPVVGGAAWSLPYELWFYFALPLMGLAVGARRAPAVLIALSAVASAAAAWWLTRHHGWTTAAVFLGGWTAAFLLRRSDMRRIATHPIAAIVAVAALAAVTRTEATVGLASTLLLTIAFVIIAGGNTLFGVLTSTPLRVLGEISYSVYLLHGACLYIAFTMLGPGVAARLTPMQHWLVVFAGVPLIVAVCSLTFRTIEAPALASVDTMTPSLQASLRRFAMRDAARTLVLLLALSVLVPASARAQGNPDWHRAIPGFKIAGNLYYVGTADLAVYLIATPQGNIIINGDFKEDVPTIRKSVEGLGFKWADTKIILISHAHGDHDEGVGLIKQQTGAQLMVMDADVAQVESTARGRPGAKVDRVLHDRDVVELGGSKLTARLTPGHTPGCTTWTMQVADGGKTLNAVIIGSPNVNAGYVLVGPKRNYPDIAGDYVKTFATLKTLPVDLFLGAHGAYFNLKEKLPKMGSGTNPFIDPDGYKAYVAERDQAFEKELAKQRSEARVPDTPGFELAWNHVAISVPNIAESIAWYEKMLGFKGTVRGQPNANARQIVADLRRGDVTIELFQLADAAPLPESRKNPSEDFRTHGVKHFGFEVKNLAAVLAELKAKGVKVAFEMRITPTEDFAFISDNAGNAIELIEHKR